MKPIKGFLIILASSLACNRSVDLRINGRSSEYLEARVAKSDAMWKVSTDLPVGHWVVSLQAEQIPIQVEVVGSHSVAWWKITGDRMHQERPFVLELRKVDSQEVCMVMEVHPLYPGQKFVQGVLKVVYWVMRPGVRIKQGQAA